MTIAEPIFWKYIIYDAGGFMVGIFDDTPEEATEAYQEYIELIKAAEEKGIKL